MRLLLDTQAWLWMQVSPDRLRSATRDVIVDASTELVLSAASSWEIAIKWALGKLPLPQTPADYVVSRLQSGGITALPVSHQHALHVAALPPHHRDPFDRVLIAQAQLEALTVCTADPVFGQYDVPVLWAAC